MGELSVLWDVFPDRERGQENGFFYLPNLALCVILKLRSILPSLDGLGLLLASMFDGC